MNSDATQGDTSARRWQPLTAVQRRVVGVLIEKAKTTPDSYPMTLNALTNGCNQKSNRAPHMDLSQEDVAEAAEQLREIGAVAEVQSSARAAKFRHYMYEWLGVDKVELAVMAELLLRGEQTIGELRGRASRMEPIADLHALRPVLDSLIQKDLVVALTPSGRGQIVSHNLYTPERLEKLRQQYSAGHHTPDSSTSRSPTVSAADSPPAVATPQIEALQAEITQLRNEIERLGHEIDSLKSRL